MWSQLDSERRLLSPSPLDRLVKNYEGRAEFLFLYGAEAVPEAEVLDAPGPDHFRALVPEYTDLPPLTQTHTWAERARRAALFAEKTKTLRRVLVDEVGEKSVSRLYGAGHLLTVVVDLRGRVALRRESITPEKLEKELRPFLVNANPQASQPSLAGSRSRVTRAEPPAPGP
jgi:hypothetical protein